MQETLVPVLPKNRYCILFGESIVKRIAKRKGELVPSRRTIEYVVSSCVSLGPTRSYCALIAVF